MPRTRHAQTLRTPVTVSGHGLHRNLPCTVVIQPASQASGLVFRHTPSGVEIPALAEHVGDCSLSTSLAKDGVKLQTIEHLLSALRALGVDHALIEVDGEELPILDGSAAPWAQAILQAGLRPMAAWPRTLRILKPVEVRRGEKWVRVSPWDGLRVAYTIVYENTHIGRQTREMTVTPEKYRRDLGSARTFCLESDIAFMRSRGLALGGSLDNAVVFGEDGPLNESLRYEDEAVRHKMLDLVGDLALLGGALEGFVEAHAAGHAMHVDLARAILADPSCFEWVDSASPAPARSLFPQGMLIPHPIPA